MYAPSSPATGKSSTSPRRRPHSSRNKPPVRDAGAKYQVLKAVAQALTARSLPPVDERGKSILVSQVGTLLRGGYPLELVQRVAVAAALAWDERRGHSRLMHLAQRIRLVDADAQRARHQQQKADEGMVDPRVARLLSQAR